MKKGVKQIQIDEDIKTLLEDKGYKVLESDVEGTLLISNELNNTYVRIELDDHSIKVTQNTNHNNSQWLWFDEWVLFNMLLERLKNYYV